MSEPIYHWHHIVPRHAGGTNDPSNLVRLTIPEHAESHRLLWEQYGRLGDKLAWLALSGKTDEAEQARKELVRSPEVRSRQRDGLAKRDPAYKEKLSKALAGHAVSAETREKISHTLKGHDVSEETREKVAASNRARQGNAVCHPTRPHGAKGLCGSCYMMYRQKQRENRITDEEMQRYVECDTIYKTRQKALYQTDEERREKRREQQRKYYEKTLQYTRRRQRESAVTAYD